MAASIVGKKRFKNLHSQASRVANSHEGDELQDDSDLGDI